MWLSITPEIPVRDVVASQRYYRDVFGLKIGWTAEDQSYGALYIEHFELFLKRTEDPAPGHTCCVRVSDVDAVHARLLEAGAQIVSPLEVKPWQMREFSVCDPDGQLLRIGQSTLEGIR
jgi:catechol 2,3-dioxygenase-like lactoylglutathione lyase family enzyme